MNVNIRTIYENCQKISNNSLTAEMDDYVKRNGLHRPNTLTDNHLEVIDGIFEKYGVSTKDGVIKENHVNIKNSNDIKKYIKEVANLKGELTSSIMKICESYATFSNGKIVLFENDLKGLNESLNYFHEFHFGKNAVNESSDVDEKNYKYFRQYFGEFINDYIADLKNAGFIADDMISYGNLESAHLEFRDEPEDETFDTEVKAIVGLLKENGIKVYLSDDDVANGKVNEESYADNLITGDFEINTVGDFTSSFSDDFFEKYEITKDNIGMWFNDGGVLKISLKDGGNGIICNKEDINFVNGESEIIKNDKEKLAGAIVQWVNNDSAEIEINENKDNDLDDTGLSEYNFKDIDSIKIGSYQVIDSYADEFDVFDVFEVRSIDKNTNSYDVTLPCGTEKKFTVNEMSSVIAIFYDEILIIKECFDETFSSQDEIKNLISHYNISYDEVTKVINDVCDNDFKIPYAQDSFVEYFIADKKFYITNDQCGSCEEIEPSCLLLIVINHIVACKQNNVGLVQENVEEVDFEFVYDDIMKKNLICDDCIADFIEKWTVIAENKDYNALIELLKEYEIDPNIIDGEKVEDFSDIMLLSEEDLTSFLAGEFSTIPYEEIYNILDDEKIKEFTIKNKEFYDNDENYDNDEIVADKYVGFLIDIMTSWGINTHDYR